MMIRNRFVHAPRPGDGLSCPCGSADLKLGGETIRLREIGDIIHISRTTGPTPGIVPLDGTVTCVGCGKTYDKRSAWDPS